MVWPKVIRSNKIARNGILMLATLATSVAFKIFELGDKRMAHVLTSNSWWNCMKIGYPWVPQNDTVHHYTSTPFKLTVLWCFKRISHLQTHQNGIPPGRVMDLYVYLTCVCLMGHLQFQRVAFSMPHIRETCLLREATSIIFSWNSTMLYVWNQDQISHVILYTYMYNDIYIYI